MTKWLQERYISRAEHQQIVAYYKRLVVQLYGKVRDLRAQAEEPSPTRADMDREPPMAWSELPRQTKARSLSGGDNVIHFDFRRRR